MVEYVFLFNLFVRYVNNFITILSYYSVLGITQSFFLGVDKVCAFSFYQIATGFFGCGMLHHFNRVLMELILDGETEKGQILDGHFYFIIIAFYIMPMDGLVFRFGLSKFTKNPFLQIIFWFSVTYVVWYITYLSPWIVDASGENDTYTKNWVYSFIEWFMAIEFITGLAFEDIAESIKWLDRKHFAIRGLILTGYYAVVTFIMMYASYYLCYLGWDDDEMTKTERWFQSFLFGTYPLIPAALMELYSENFRYEKSPLWRFLKRWGTILVFSVVNYFLFHLYYVPLNFIGQHKWTENNDINFNFTLLAIPMTYLWYFRRFGLLKTVEYTIETEEPKIVTSPLQDEEEIVSGTSSIEMVKCFKSAI
eukprot:TRINITY_DN325094_c0_g1_i1.p1 TRINITY_DN325094_c0_g1~~TRINITY_DN325094_c0_g1_i1.p1  ORF type:complete len:365 (+),score=72.46 TRINITY_DN325094_c0_g1_i1:237-1331(+)